MKCTTLTVHVLRYIVIVNYQSTSIPCIININYSVGWGQLAHVQRAPIYIRLIVKYVAYIHSDFFFIRPTKRMLLNKTNVCITCFAVRLKPP